MRVALDDLRAAAHRNPVPEQLSLGEDRQQVDEWSLDDLLHVEGAAAEPVLVLVEDLYVWLVSVPCPTLITPICNAFDLLSKQVEYDDVFRKQLHLLSFFELFQ